MNYINHLSRFYACLHREDRLTSQHISLYLALFQCWNSYRFHNPFPVFREKLMRLSGIRTKNTYSKCLRELHQFGYIIYSPALNKFHRPMVGIVHLAISLDLSQPLLFDPAEKTEEQPEVKNDTGPVSDMSALMVKIDTLPVSNSVHYNKQYINNVNSERETHPPIPLKDQFSVMQTATPRAAPSREEVAEYFKQAGFPATEASLFFHHYQTNGWKQGGRIPIADWQAAACKWMDYEKKLNDQLYAKRTKHGGTDHLHVEQDKDYSIPL